MTRIAKNRYTHAVLMLVLGVFVEVMTASGCTLLWALNQDPDGLPCDPGTPPCLAGYACIDGKCRKTEVSDQGEICAAQEECKDGFVCTDAYGASCSDGLNCDLGPSDGLRCRVACNPAQAASAQCGAGSRCFPTEEPVADGFCQSGVCSVDSECGRNGDRSNLCVDIVNGPGSGICTEGCEPLDCNPATGCDSCPAERKGCEPFTLNPVRFGCVPPGGAPHGAACDAVATFCQAGSFCFIPNGASSGVCARLCRLSGGQPACDANETCNPLDANEDTGFCTR